jgi:hypothetical protein
MRARILRARSFQRLENMKKKVPTIGKKRPKVSNDWKKPRVFFQRLENRPFFLPTIGKCLLLLFLIGGLPVAGRAEWPDGAELMARVRAALPAVPLEMSGELQARDRRGNMVRMLPVEMRLDWGGQPPTAQYVVRDRFGAESERLQLAWPAPGEMTFALFAGDPPVAVEEADLQRSIAGLDLYWSDLTLAFLWWEDAEVAGTERVRGRSCYVVDVPAPPGAQSPYAGVRLWIDQEANLMMQADAYDRRNRMMRRLQVKSLRKIDEIWMVQNLDMLSSATRERVTLRVRHLRALDDSFEEIWDE